MSTARQRRLQQDLAASAAAASELPKAHAATVETIQTGAAKGGVALVRVRYRGALMVATYAGHYTPNIGDRVSVVDCEGLLHIQDRIIGHPQTPGGN